MKKLHSNFYHKNTVGLLICLFLVGVVLGASFPDVDFFEEEQKFYLEKDMTDTFDDEIKEDKIENQSDNKIMTHSNMVDYIAYRIHYVRDFYNKYNNPNIKPVSKKTARAWANQIVYHSLVREDRDISPLMVTAILETETNFIPGHYDSGQSLGIHSMQITTAKEIANELGESYSREKHMDPLAQGIRYMVYYLHKSQYKYDTDHKIIASYNLGYRGAKIISDKKAEEFYYIDRVQRRWDDYIDQMFQIKDFENIELIMDLNYH